MRLKSTGLGATELFGNFTEMIKKHIRCVDAGQDQEAGGMAGKGVSQPQGLKSNCVACTVASDRVFCHKDAD